MLDVIGVVTGLDSSCSSTVWERNCTLFKFPGRGQRETQVTCVKGAVTIVMLLPGRAAASVRKSAASTLVRYLGGDLSLVDSIAANHLHQQEMDDEDPRRIFGQQVESDRVKRAREELTIAELEGALKRRRVESIQYCLDVLVQTGQSDGRDKLRCTDMIRTVAFGSPVSSSEPQQKEVCIRAVVNAVGRT